MTHLKSYTSLEQSKVLANILPHESADMCYMYLGTEDKEYENIPICAPAMEGDCACWSLAVLLSVLPTFTIDSSDDHYFRVHCYTYFSEWHNNPVDACYAIIIKLHEANIL